MVVESWMPKQPMAVTKKVMHQKFLVEDVKAGSILKRRRAAVPYDMTRPATPALRSVNASPESRPTHTWGLET